MEKKEKEGEGYLPDRQHQPAEAPRHQMTLDQQTSCCQVQTGLTADSVSAVNPGKAHKQQNSLSSTSHTNSASVGSNPSNVIPPRLQQGHPVQVFLLSRCHS